MEKKQKIKNKNYRQFLDDGVINLLTKEQIEQALSNVKGKHIQEGRSLIIAGYLTGARPNEYLRLKGKDIKRDKSYVVVQMQGSKNGLPRPIYLQHKQPLVKELYKHSTSVFPEQYLFYHYRATYIRIVSTKKGIKEREEISHKLRYYFKLWFSNVLEDGISPYFLRHNRFSKLASAGIDDNSLMQLKGSRTFQSIQSYKHLSTKSAKTIAKKID